MKVTWSVVRLVKFMVVKEMVAKFLFQTKKLQGDEIKSPVQ